jgi:hypothetical protein
MLQYERNMAIKLIIQEFQTPNCLHYNGLLDTYLQNT